MQTPNIELNTMNQNNQLDNVNQPILVNQVNLLPFHCIPLSDINT